MQKRKNFLYIFLLFFFFSVLLIISSKIGLSKGLGSAVSTIVSPFQSIAYSALTSANIFGNNAQTEKLKTENQSLTQKLVDQKKLIEDNKALRDQFQTPNLNNLQLLPARIIGSPSFIPGLSSPETFTLDQGEANGVKVGDAVVYKNILVGKIDKTQSFVARAVLITNSASSFTAKTMGSSNLGVIKGQGGGEMILDNVLLSENLTNDDLILTKGDMDTSAAGFPPDLIVGKIKSINKNPSALFQKAEVESPIDFENLSEVFIVTGFK